MQPHEAGEVIRGYGGRVSLCGFCQQNAACQHGGPRVLPVVALVLDYLNEARNGLPGYPWPGDWRHQPEWFMDLLKTARAAEAEAVDERRKMETEHARVQAQARR